MKYGNERKWNDRYADCPINEQQAMLWRQQTRPQSAAQYRAQQRTSGSAAVSEGAVRNPWLENLPKAAPRGRKKGLAIFVALIALMLGVSAAYWGVFGVPERTSGGAYAGELSSKKELTSIPVISGGDTRLIVQKEHGETLSAQEIYQKVNPAVVAVLAIQENGAAALGTGVIFTGDGFLLTNAHVIEGGQSCTILLSDDRRYEAKLVGYDEKRDVAVLKAIDAADLPTAEIGDSTQMVEGDKVYAIGNPLGLELRGTLTDGIVSAINRDVKVGGRTMTLIQTNAALNEGNSGGPLINEYGQVVGLNVVKMSAGAGETVVEGLGFAVPSETVEYLSNQILKFGAPLPDTSLGITVYAIGEEDGDVHGLMVYEVMDGSCADAAGLRAGDVILSADGEVTLKTADLLAVRRSHAPGETMVLTVLRGLDTITVTVILDGAE